MKYNTTYTPKVSLKDTIIKTNQVINEIKKYYFSKFSILKLTSPMFYEEADEKIIQIRERTRKVSFDTLSEYKVAELIISHTNWMREMLDKLKLKEGEGVSIESSTIWRDLEMNPITSPIKNELTFMFIVDKNINPLDVVKNETNNLFDILETFEQDFAKEYGLEKLNMKTKPFITPQMMENEFPNIPPRNREQEFASEYDGYILRNPGMKMFSGHYHTILPTGLYTDRNFNQIIMNDTINSSALKVATIAQIANGQLLKDQLSLSNELHLLEKEFYREQTKKEYNVFEVKINVGRMMMALLKKGHIAEVQPGNLSEEVFHISSRYKIEIY